MRIALISFTQAGSDLADSLAGLLIQAGHEAVCTKGFGPDKIDHKLWTADGFETKDALVFVGATGIAVRSVAPYLKSKATDPCVVTIDEKGRFVVPLVSGHIGGGNELACRIAALIGAEPVVTTASDINGVFAVDTWATKQGMKVLEPERIKNVTSKLLAGGDVTVCSDFAIAGTLPEHVSCTDTVGDVHIGIRPAAISLNLVPRCLTVGIGCRRGTPQAAIEKAFVTFMADNNIAEDAVCQVASIDLKANEEGLVAFADNHGLPFITFSSDELNALEGQFASSDFVQGVTGTSTVCERAAVAAGGTLIVGKTIVDSITFALSIKEPTLSWNDESKGSLWVVGLGPGDPAYMNQAAIEALTSADLICGYHVYTDLAAAVAPDTPVFTTPMRKEIDRCRAALEQAAQGKKVAMVCSGDAGVYGMAGLCMELAHEFEPVDIEVICGVTAALSGAAVLGAPLTHDFCTISLSDLLTPWDKIEKRLDAAGAADFCIAIYNPGSHRRKDHLKNACDILLKHRSPETVCGVVRQIGRPEQSKWVGTLAELREYEIDMFCTCFIGNEQTTIIDDWMVTPRGYQAKPEFDGE